MYKYKKVELEVGDYNEDGDCNTCKYCYDMPEVCILKRCFRAISSLVDAYEEDKNADSD